MRILTVISALILMGWASVQAETTQEKPFVYDDKGRRDPLMKLVTADGAIVSYDMDLSIDDLALEGIIFDAQQNSLAIINGKIVKVNDKMGLFTVSRIEQNRVILHKGQESFFLELKKEE